MSEYKLPQEFMDEHLQENMCSCFLGFRLDELSKAELIAIVEYQGNAEIATRKRHSKDLDVLGTKF